MKPHFWQGKRVLLTGHTGFKGSWLSLLKVDLVGYALMPPTQPSLFEVARVADAMTSIMGNVTDYQHLYQVIDRYRPEALTHMAAQSVGRSQPLQTRQVLPWYASSHLLL